jgi:hypothetical protein
MVMIDPARESEVKAVAASYPYRARDLKHLIRQTAITA